MIRILIIEPHHDFAVMLEARLRAHAGIDVRRVSQFHDAADHARWNPTVALVATEVLSLTSSTSRLRANLPSLQYVVGMATTAQADATCNRVVTKPFDLDALVKHVERQLAALRSN